jgi:phage terminase small subunit
MAKDDLTPKQEAFALAYVETGNAAEAYRRAYDVEPTKQSNSWVYVEASQLLDNPKVALRVEALQKEAERLSLYNVKAAFDEYEAARKLAADVKNPSAFVAAINGKVKLFGLDQPTKVDLSTMGKPLPPAIDLSKAPAELLEWIVAQSDAAKTD